MSSHLGFARSTPRIFARSIRLSSGPGSHTSPLCPTRRLSRTSDRGCPQQDSLDCPDSPRRSPDRTLMCRNFTAGPLLNQSPQSGDCRCRRPRCRPASYQRTTPPAPLNCNASEYPVRIITGSGSIIFTAAAPRQTAPELTSSHGWTSAIRNLANAACPLCGTARRVRVHSRPLSDAPTGSHAARGSLRKSASSS